jgi:hypothetical protein
MGRLIRSEINAILFMISIVVVCILGFVSFDNPNMFSNAFVALMIILCMVHKGNHNLITLFLILVMSRMMSAGEAALVGMEAFSSSILLKVVVYSLATTVAFIFRYQMLSKLLFASLLIVIPAEVYWYYTGYPAPMIHIFYMGVTQTILVRYALLTRPVLFHSWGEVKPTNLDFKMSKFFFLTAIINLAMVFEYLVRHLTDYYPLIIYSAYEYLQHSASVLMIIVVLFYTVAKPRTFSA